MAIYYHCIRFVSIVYCILMIMLIRIVLSLPYRFRETSPVLPVDEFYMVSLAVSHAVALYGLLDENARPIRKHLYISPILSLMWIVSRSFFQNWLVMTGPITVALLVMWPFMFRVSLEYKRKNPSEAAGQSEVRDGVVHMA